MPKITIITAVNLHKRVALGLTYIEKALHENGFDTVRISEGEVPAKGLYRQLGDMPLIYAGDRTVSAFIQELETADLLLYHTEAPVDEGFYLATCAGNLTVVSGGSATGTLYGCLELAERINMEKALPKEIAFSEKPVYKLRGPAIGVQKTTIEPPRKTYEYPITPDRFPWFYDKAQWQDFLDLLLAERCNVIYIWSGHPFASLVKVPEYPEALEVTEEEYQKNVELFTWLTQACDERGIWVVLKFYNIHISLPFAQKHGLDLHQSKPSDLVADYTRKSIARFIQTYPHIGLMACLGEALRGDQHKADWCSEVVLPGVKDGIKLAGLTENPPVIIRAHDCDPELVMKQATEVYDHLYTMWKYNGEGLTTWQPRGGWQDRHQGLAELDTTHIINVHILANLEPFRFGAPSFVQKSMQAAKYRLGGQGLHLYPLFYWDWPYSPDKAKPRLKQLTRDWLWFATWFRYAWNPDREPAMEKLYWTRQIARHYGCDLSAAEALLTAYESSGECAPRILRSVGITEGNRQTMSLGMTMSQLTNAKRYGPNHELWLSVAPQCERLDEYIQRELEGLPHVGETPEDMLKLVSDYAEKALVAARSARDSIRCNRDEYNRLLTDLEAIHAMSCHYANKVRAAQDVLRYKYTMDKNMVADLSYLDSAANWMKESLAWYERLTDLTEDTYLYANSMQTPQRKIPFPDGGKYGHWRDCLPVYRDEYEAFTANLEKMKQGWMPKIETEETADVKELKQVSYKILSGQDERYDMKKGIFPFTDAPRDVQNCAAELIGLDGTKLNMDEAIQRGNTIVFELEEDAQMVVGYFAAKGIMWLQVPDLETNTHADDRGGMYPVLKNAIKITGCPPVNIHLFQYEKGRHEFYLGTGAFMVLGFIHKDEKIKARDAQLQKESLESLDWLYEAPKAD